MTKLLRLITALFFGWYFASLAVAATMVKWNANQAETENIFSILTMVPPLMLAVPFMFALDLAKDIGLGLAASLSIYFAPSAMRWLLYSFDRGIAYWVVRETPISQEEWTTFLAAHTGSDFPGTWYCVVPTDLPEVHSIQPGIRFYPASPETRRLATKVATALGGFLQVR